MAPARLEAAVRLRSFTGALDAETTGSSIQLLTCRRTPLADCGCTAGVRITGVRITGFTDRNRDGLDDDGRATFRTEGRAVCAQLPRNGSKFRIHSTGAATFRRVTPRPPGARSRTSTRCPPSRRQHTR
jgi:hypothetical protein